MPPVPGFTDNPFRTRSDLLGAAQTLLRPLEQFRSPAGARVKLQPSTCAAFDDVAAQLEGFARPLWAIAGLLNKDVDTGGGAISNWLRGFEAGVDPENGENWGDLGDFDQRMVEMESIAFTLLTAPDATLSLLSQACKDGLSKWLSQINRHAMPENNWRWFRVFVNLALVKVLDVPKKEVKDMMEGDFAKLDSFYIDQGWSSDGLWCDERKQADYYSGSFAIQFAQLLYVRLASDDDERVERYKQQARDFATEYWRYFDTNGAAIPFGRSMTYRFAFGAFWSAIAVAGVQLGAPLEHAGAVKGLLLRHLRWWSQHPDMFNSNGTLNIGFAYPNMNLSEDYNSPQSVYWCLKSFIVLGLPEDHAFWTCDEQPHPLESSPAPWSLGELRTVALLWPPRHIICSSPEHHFLLSAGQMTKKGHRSREAKYGKFAYSSAFAFSVPSGPLLQQMAPDSTLCVSIDSGETWKVRSEPVSVKPTYAIVEAGGGLPSSTVPVLLSSWRPWSMFPIEIETALVPVAQQFPGWHIRVHRIRWLSQNTEHALAGRLEVVDAGFALPALTAKGYHVPAVADLRGVGHEGHSSTDSSCLVKSEAGGSGVFNLTSASENPEVSVHVRDDGVRVESQGHLVRADPNTNLMSQRTFIPAIKHTVLRHSKDSSAEDPSSETYLVSGVFGVSSLAGRAGLFNITRMLSNRPRLSSIEQHPDGGAENIYRVTASV